MGTVQDFTKTNEITSTPRPYTMLTDVQRAYVDWKALNGIITDDDGVREMKLDDLAKMMGVTRQAFYEGKKLIPNFWDLVTERRKELGSQSRLARFHQTWYLKAIKMDNWQVSEAWARNFDPTYKEAKQKIEHELGNSWAALLEHKREIIEGEVVDGPNTD